MTEHSSLFLLPKMDCLAEEQLVRMALERATEVRGLSFDLSARTLTVRHEGDPAAVLERLEALQLGARLVGRAPDEPAAGLVGPESTAEAGTLWVVLVLNAALFVVELVAGWLAQSTGLLADSLDMLADAAVYGVALYAVRRPAVPKRRAAHVMGWLQLVLALGAFAEVARRAVLGSDPEPPAMVGVSLLALAANVAVLVLVTRHRHAGVHMKASAICSATDVQANLGVIGAGALVAATGSPLPDLVIGVVIASLVLRGAIRILRLR